MLYTSFVATHICPRSSIPQRCFAVVLRFVKYPWVATVAALIATLGAAPAAAWQTAHGRPDNSGFEDVETLPALQPLPTSPRIGRIASGAGPVVAGDGTVYVADSRGTLTAFAADGTPGWHRDIAGGQAIMSSPAIGHDGAIYVIGSARMRDSRANPPTDYYVMELHKFSAGGAYLWHKPLPNAAGGLTPGAPVNIWWNGNADILFVPTISNNGNYITNLQAYTEDGFLIANQQVSTFVPTVTGGDDGWLRVGCMLFTFDLLCIEFHPAPAKAKRPPHRLPDDMARLFPAVAIHAGSGDPVIMMSDGMRELAGFAFTGSSFVEKFRVSSEMPIMTSTPVAWPDGHAMISTATSEKNQPPEGATLYAGTNMTTLKGAGPYSFAPATLVGNSRYAIVHRYGGVSISRGTDIIASADLPGESVVPAAASRTHFFVSTVDGLHTFNINTYKEVASFSWKNGGASPPVIGPQGHVYAIAGNRLYVFPPATAPQAAATETDNSQPDSGTANSTPANGARQRFKPPLTASGNRLFACEKLDGEDCGKGDYRSIAQAFCKAQGFAEATGFNVDSKKLTAETLDGQFCTKKKCKVFDRIECGN